MNFFFFKIYNNLSKSVIRVIAVSARSGPALHDFVCKDVNGTTHETQQSRITTFSRHRKKKRC